MPDAQVKISLLPGTTVSIGETVIDRLPSRRLAALLAYLVLHPNWQPREQIAEAIWPDQPEGNGLASLRNALSVLRRLLESGAAAIETTKTHARLTKELCDSDVWQFQRVIEAGDSEASVALYGGDLLVDTYDEWLEPFRESLRLSFHSAAAIETERLLASKEPAKAVRLAERWRASDPFEPEAVRLYALSLASTGRTAAAFAAVDTFETEGFGEFDGDAIRAEIQVRQKARTTPSESKLPVYFSRFFGRERELDEIWEWASGSSPLLTVLGMGGMGKTRLTIEACRAKLPGSPEVVFIPLAGADSPAAMIAALMGAFGLRESDTETSEAVIKGHLAGLKRPTVVVLDNLEQIVTTAASVVMDLIPTSPQLKFLCTSRELLGIEGERLLSLTPLQTSIESESPQQSSAVQMFVDRARNTRSDFALTTQNRDNVVALCQELDGLPLAIEIVAAWAGAWSISQMRTNVQDNKIVSRKRGHDPRHQSLEACIEWSFRLLDLESQRFLAMLSLFRGGWTLRAAEAVTDNPRSAELLASLLDRSLIYSTEIDGQMRFSVLETVRSYCRSKLSEADAQPATVRFMVFFKELAITHTNPCAGIEERMNHRSLDHERENFEAVAALCEEGLGSFEAAAGLVGQLHLHWTYRGQARFGIALTERILAAKNPGPRGPGYFRAYQSLSLLSQETGDLPKAEFALVKMQEVADQNPDVEVRFRALTQTGNYYNQQGRFDIALESHSRALVVAGEMNHPRMDAVVHCNLAESLFGLGRAEEAVKHWTLANQFDRQSGNLAGEAMLYLGFGECYLGNVPSGAERLLTYLRNAEGLGFGRGYSRGVYYTALSAILTGQAELAAKLAWSAKATMDSEEYILDAIEKKCFAIIHAKLKELRFEDEPPGEEILPIKEAITLAYGFLESTALAVR